MIRKDVVIAVLIIACMGTALFLVKSTTSQTLISYNPVLDINHDGKIDMKDIAGVASSFGATGGDPTVPVNVTDNWAENTYTQTIAPNHSWLIYNTTAGFSKVTVSFNGYCSTGAQTYEIYVGFTCGPNTYQVDNFDDSALIAQPVLIPPGVANYTTKTYEKTGSQIWICMYNPANIITGPVITVQVSFFMTA